MGTTASASAAVWTKYIPDVWWTKRLGPAKTGKGNFVFVDVGGSHGHELKAFMQRFPEVQGRFVLQDLDVGDLEHNLPHGHMCEEASRQFREMEKISHSFFDPQPVRGADIYLLARILHDWPDQQAREILAHLREAMSKDSTLLIYERVFPDMLSKLSHIDVLCDASMMAFFSSAERSGEQFKGLLHSAGLALVNVWREESADDHTEAVLEVIRAE